jgi:ankyrin repeat protein
MAENRPARTVPLLLALSLLMQGATVVLVLSLSLGWWHPAKTEPTPVVKTAVAPLPVVKEDPTEKQEELKARQARVRYAHRLTRMKDAIIKGEFSLVLAVLKDGASVHDRDEQDETPLHWAAALGRTPVAEELLLLGADPELKNAKKQTPLMLAQANGFEVTAQLLRDPAAAIKKRERLGQLTQKTAYMDRLARIKEAIDRGQVTEVKQLLQDVSVSDRDEKGETPLMWAAAKGNVNICLLLLANGADAAARDKAKKTVLMRAAEKGHVPVMAVLLTPQAEAARIPAVFKEAGVSGAPLWPALTLAQVTVADVDGETALLRAARAGQADAVKQLHAHLCVAPSEKDALPEGKLRLAEMKARQAALDKDGLAKGVAFGIDVRDSREHTPLMIAAAAGDTATTLALLSGYLHADRHATNPEGRTAVMLATANGHAATAEAILKTMVGRGIIESPGTFGQDPAWFDALCVHRDRTGKTALQLARDRKDKAAQERLLAFVKWHIVNWDPPHEGIAQNANCWGDPLGCAVLLEVGADPNKVGMWRLAEKGQADSLQVIFKSCAGNRDRLNKIIGYKSTGDTLLHWAAQQGHLETVRVILDVFGDDRAARQEYINQKGEGSLTALDLARREKHQKIVDLLQKHLNP